MMSLAVCKHPNRQVSEGGYWTVDKIYMIDYGVALVELLWRIHSPSLNGEGMGALNGEFRVLSSNCV